MCDAFKVGTTHLTTDPTEVVLDINLPLGEYEQLSAGSAQATDRQVENNQ